MEGCSSLKMLAIAAQVFAAQFIACLACDASGGKEDFLQGKLLEAVESGDAALVETILLEGATPNYVPEMLKEGRCRSEKGFEAWSPYVLIAANHGHLAVLKILVDYGADIDAQFVLCGSRGVIKEGTALMAALVNAHEGAVDFLLEHRADTEVVEEMHNNTAVTALAAATRSPEYGNSVFRDADLKNLSRLIRANADLDWQDSLGRTALWLAASAGKAAMVQQLLDAGANTILEADCREEKGLDIYERKCTARRIAEIRGHQEIVTFFDRALSAGH